MCEYNCRSPLYGGSGECIELVDGKFRCICDQGYVNVNELDTPSCIPQHTIGGVYIVVFVISVMSLLYALLLRQRRKRKPPETAGRNAGRLRQDKLRTELSYGMFSCSSSIIVGSVMLLGGLSYRQVMPVFAVLAVTTLLSMLTTIRILVGAVPRNLLQPGTPPRRVCDFIDASPQLNVAFRSLAIMAGCGSTAGFWFPYIGIFFVHLACCIGLVVIEGTFSTVAFSFYILTHKEKGSGKEAPHSAVKTDAGSVPSTPGHHQRKSVQSPVSASDADFNRGMRKLIMLLVFCECIGAVTIMVAFVGAFTRFGAHHSILFLVFVHGTAPSIWLAIIAHLMTPTSKPILVHVTSHEGQDLRRGSSLTIAKRKMSALEAPKIKDAGTLRYKVELEPARESSASHTDVS